VAAVAAVVAVAVTTAGANRERLASGREKGLVSSSRVMGAMTFSGLAHR